MTFLPNPNNLPCVDHIDTNKKNNCVENLRWASYKENSNNPLTIEHHKASYTEDVIKRMKETRLKNNTKNKERKIYRFTKDGTYIDEFLGATAASKAVGVRPNTITTACLKGCASAGYLWTYDKNRVSKYRSQSERQMKKVYQYDNSGALIGEWNSVLEAVAKTGNKGISKAARNAGRLRAKGFFWSYEKVDNIFKNNPED